ncbi:EamA family transporter RarD [Luteolibacter algae]|uniref:EamA family transporter RarD n=1 Tax=Luteolibacter algae TaxID=454151 RepID=UPI0036DB78F6
MISALLCFGLWGVLPIYWKHLDFISPPSLVAQRTIWTCLAMWPLLWWRGIGVKGDLRTISWHFLSGLLIGGNWLLYVWAVVSEQMIEGALGYYINPFFNMLFGLIWFGERQNRLQMIAIAVAFCGVLMQIPGVGHFPWLALSIALTFSLYGVVRKRSPLGAIDGLTVETSALVPIAVGWLIYQNSNIPEAFGGSWENALWLAGTGVITAFPLLFFGYASRTIRLSTLGMLQFIGPTIQFLIGWKMYGEPMSTPRLLSFGLIWLAIGLYAYNAISRRQNERQPMLAE